MNATDHRPSPTPHGAQVRGLVSTVLVIFCLFTVLSHANSLFATGVYSDDSSLVVSAVGDIMMGSTYPFDDLPTCDGSQVFAKVKQHLTGDIVFGNLEGPLADNAIPSKCRYSQTGSCFAFVTPERYAPHLTDAGFTVLSIANNHTHDCGPYGVERTLAVLRREGIQPSGGSVEARLQMKGKRIAIAGFSYKASEYAHSILHLAEAQQRVKALKRDNDIVIVSFHGGAEGHRAQVLKKGPETFLGENRGDVIAFARAAVDAGADLVLGHGPHVWRAMEIYKGKIIAYSLGNFLTYKLFNVKGPSGITGVLKVKLSSSTGDFLEGHIVPLRLTHDGLPEEDDQKQLVDTLRALNAQSFPGSELVISERGAIGRSRTQ